MSDDTDIVSDDTTTDSKRRWIGLSTAVAALYCLTVPVFVAAHVHGLVDLSSVPATWFALYGGGAATAIEYALGKPIRNAAKHLVEE